MDPGLTTVLIDSAIVLAAVAVVAALVRYYTTRPRRREPRVLSLEQVQEGQSRTGIVAIEGSAQGPGLSLYLRNRGASPVRVVGEAGTVVKPADERWPELLFPRTRSLDLPAKSTAKMDLVALSLAARKLPPGTRSEGAYRAGGPVARQEVLDLLATVDSLEAEAAGYVARVDGERVTYRPMDDALTILTSQCRCEPLENGSCRVRVPASVIQYALWQITDGLSFDELVDLVVQPPSREGRAALVNKVLAANILLEAAGLRPTSGI